MNDIVASMLSESQAQAPAEGTAEASAAPEQNGNDFLERFNRLSAKEAAMRKREQEIKAERETWKSKVERLERLERLKDEDPEAALGELGLDYDKLTQRRLSSLGNEADKEIRQLKEELKAIKEGLTTEKQRAEQEATGQALQRANEQVRKICETDDYELIRSFDDYDLVLDTAAEYYRSTGKMVSLEEAAKFVEGHLEKKLEKILAAKKVAARQTKLEPEPKSDSFDGALSHAQESRTLSSSMGSTSRPTLAQTEEDLRQAALRALRGG